MGIATAPEETPQGNAEPEESIEQYMAALLERVRGVTGPAQAEQGTQNAYNQQTRTATSLSLPTANSTQTDQGEASTPATPAEKPVREPSKKRVPESADKVSAMRGLANLNAYLAIQTHSVQQLYVDARRTLLLAVATMLSAFFFLRTPTASQPLGCVATCLATMVAGACCWQYFRITGEMARRSPTGDDDQKD
jgi:hypothetical protein